MASAVPPALRTSSTVSLTPSVLSTAINFAPSLVNMSDAARPMPLPAPVMMTDLPSRRPMTFSRAFYEDGIVKMAWAREAAPCHQCCVSACAGELRVFPGGLRQRNTARCRFLRFRIRRGAIDNALGDALHDAGEAKQVVGEIPVEV